MMEGTKMTSALGHIAKSTSPATISDSPININYHITINVIDADTDHLESTLHKILKLVGLDHKTPINKVTNIKNVEKMPVEELTGRIERVFKSDSGENNK